MTYGDIFTGGGGASLGAKAAGFELAFGIELDPAIAEVANANLGNHVMAVNVLEVDPRRLEPVDVLHASPPCPSFSVAKTGRKETALDIALAEKVAEFIRVLQPQVFTLENVEGYKRAKAWKLIENALYGLGYWVNVSIENSANYSVPQTRRRLIARAVKGGFVPQLPSKEPWVGWYQAIEDLIPTLPESRFAEWQLERLPAEICSVLVDSKNANQEWAIGYRQENQPAYTVVTDHTDSHQPRAFLVDGQTNDNGNTMTARQGDEPCFTISSSGTKRPARAFLVRNDNAGQEWGKGYRESHEPIPAMSGSFGARAWLEHGHVVAMTPRCLARFQSFPNDYLLPDKKSLACRIIGNACPPLMMQKIFSSLATSSYGREEQLEQKGPS